MRAVHRLVGSYLAQDCAAPLPARVSGRFGPEEDQHFRPAAAVDRNTLPVATTKVGLHFEMRRDARMAQGRARSLTTAQAKQADASARREQLRARLIAAKQALALRKGAS
jgi:hypothetical protein